MTAPIKVGFVIHVMQVAGAEMVVAETARRLAGRIETTIFCLDAIGALGEQLQDEGFEVVCLGRRPGIDLRVARRLAREVRQRGIDVVHAHQYSPFFYAALARLLAPGRARLILTEHGRHFPDVVGARRRWLNRLVLARQADRVTACCAFSGRALAELDGFSGRGVEVVENGIDLARYGRAADRSAVLRRLGLDPGRRFVAAVARLHPIKDHPTLLRAFAGVAERFSDVDLVLVGDGDSRAELERLTDELGLATRVRFLGVRSDVPDILGAVDVFTLTSLSEAASLTLLESMASGLPVVVTEVGGNPEIVTEGVHGLLVPRGDSAATAEALAEILGRPEKGHEMGRAGRALVEERYRLEQTVDSYLAMYDDLSRREPRAGGAAE